MITRIAPQAAALAVAIVATLSMLAGVDRLAVQEHAGTELAASAKIPAQVVVITAQRLPRS